MEVFVTDPTKTNDKFGGYICYKVKTRDLKNADAAECSVDRRYSDFVWLWTEMSKEFPGIILPPLPDKQAMGRFSSEFVESRRRALERFLQNTASHNDLMASTHLQCFLRADDSKFLRAQEDSKSQKSILKSNPFSWIEGTMNSMNVGMVDLERSAADMKVEEVSQYIAQLEKHLVAATKNADALVRRNKELSETILEFSQGIRALEQKDQDCPDTSMVLFEATLKDISQLTSACADNQLLHFFEPLDEYLHLIGSVRLAIQQRAEKKAAYMLALTDLETKANALKKVANVPGKEAQVPSREEAVRIAQINVDETKDMFEKVTLRLLNEFESFKLQKAKDMKRCVADFISQQILFNKQCEAAWDSLSPKLAFDHGSC